MNRVVTTVIPQHTSVTLHEVIKITDPKPEGLQYFSEKFPIYPITINLYLTNPPWNKFSISFHQDYFPARIKLMGSEDALQYFHFLTIDNIASNPEAYAKVFKQKFLFHYVQLVLQQPPLNQKVNICKQIKLYGVEFAQVSYFNAEFVCSLKARLSYAPTLFRLLELLEYKAILLGENKHNKLYAKYKKRLDGLINQIREKKIKISSPEAEYLKKWEEEIKFLEQEPIQQPHIVDQTDPIAIKQELNRLKNQLSFFYLDRLNNLQKHVTDYFKPYHNVEIRESYLRLLSTNEPQDHNNALMSFWGQVKKMDSFPKSTEQAILMFLNYYLQFIQLTDLKMAAMKIMLLFVKKDGIGHKLPHIYERIIFNVIKLVLQDNSQEQRNLALRCIYTLYNKMPHQLFLMALLSDYRDYTQKQQIQLLEILERLTFANIDIADKREILSFLLDILQIKQLTLPDKNKAYNIVAYLAAMFGKQRIMGEFQKLNAMILMSMQKIVEEKLAHISRERIKEGEGGVFRTSCQFCGRGNHQFKDENIFDLHIAKECPYFTNCQYCLSNIQIPQIFKHYTDECASRHEFKNCDNCNDPILIKQQEAHDLKCTRKLITKCPLCYAKLQNKLKIKQHLLIDKCPNNARSNE